MPRLVECVYANYVKLLGEMEDELIRERAARLEICRRYVGE